MLLYNHRRFRSCRCKRTPARYHDTQNRFPHLANCLKYCMAFTVALFGVLTPSKSTTDAVKVRKRERGPKKHASPRYFHFFPYLLVLVQHILACARSIRRIMLRFFLLQKRWLYVFSLLCCRKDADIVCIPEGVFFSLYSLEIEWRISMFSLKIYEYFHSNPWRCLCLDLLCSFLPSTFIGYAPPATPSFHVSGCVDRHVHAVDPLHLCLGRFSRLGAGRSRVRLPSQEETFFEIVCEYSVCRALAPRLGRGLKSILAPNLR